MKCLKPKSLRPGATIGVIAPASSGNSQLTLTGIKYLEDQGFKVKLGLSATQTHGYLSGTDELRAADINSMFADPAIDAIICLRGGYGSMRLLELINYDVIQSHPKLFIGYSDITALHISIQQRTGLVTFHGPMVASDMGKAFSDYTADALWRAITQPLPIGRINNPPYSPAPHFLVAGTALGALIGGNLSLITATLGTPYEIDTRGKILCLEEIGEAPYRIDRMLTQLLLSKKLQDAAGIVLAVCANCADEADDDSPSFTLEEVLQDRLGNLKIPILTQLYFGHTPDKATLPFGVTATLDTTGLTITEAATL